MGNLLVQMWNLINLSRSPFLSGTVRPQVGGERETGGRFEGHPQAAGGQVGRPHADSGREGGEYYWRDELIGQKKLLKEHF